MVSTATGSNDYFSYYLAQINVARMKGTNIDDAVMVDFVNNLDRINALAEQSPGFVWRLKDDDSNSATSFNPYNDEQVIINVSVWTDLESLRTFVYKTQHKDILARKQEWFVKFTDVADGPPKRYLALWWVPKNGPMPTAESSKAKLDHLNNVGPSSEAFTFQTYHDPPPCYD